MTLKETLAALDAEATQGEWEIDTLNSEGTYGSGDDTREGFSTTAICDASGKVLFDALNSDAILVQEEWDEDGGSAYDLTSAANARFVCTLVNLYRTGQLVVAPSVEEVAREIMLNRDNGGCTVKDWTTEERDNPHVAQAVRQARAILTSMGAKTDGK